MPPPQTTLTVLLFHTLRARAGTGTVTVEVDGPLSIAALWEALEARHPGISCFRPTTRVARNHAYAAPDELLYPGDEIALIPPVSGG